MFSPLFTSSLQAAARKAMSCDRGWIGTHVSDAGQDGTLAWRYAL
jgi:hypothetical protein